MDHPDSNPNSDSDTTVSVLPQSQSSQVPPPPSLDRRPRDPKRAKSRVQPKRCAEMSRMSGWADGSGQAFLPQLPAAARVGPADPCPCHHPGRAAFFTRGSFFDSSRPPCHVGTPPREYPTLPVSALEHTLSLSPSHTHPAALLLIYTISVTLALRRECQRRYRSEMATGGQRRPQRRPQRRSR